MSKYTKFVVFSLTVLSALVLSEYIEMRFDQGDSYKGIAIKMAVTIFVYVPVFAVLEKYLQSISKFYATKSKQLADNSFLGLTIGFVLALGVLYIALVYIIAHKNLLDFLR